MNSPAEQRRAARELSAQFPGVHAWYGQATHQWWAMVPLRGGSRLLCAADVRQLREEIINAQRQSWHQR